MLSERGVSDGACLSTMNVAGICEGKPGARNREPVPGLFVVGIQLGLVRSRARSRTDTSLELERHFQEGRFRWRTFGRSRPENATVFGGRIQSVNSTAAVNEWKHETIQESCELF
jgi:hypothetical protein